MLLYKYFPKHISFFSYLVLRATQRTALNDPFELLPSAKSRAAFYYKHNVHGWNMTQAEMEQYFLKGYKNNSQHYNDGIGFFERLGIISLSAYNSNLLMWSHYSSDHCGYVVQFDTDYFDFPRQHNDFPEVPQQVLYQGERPTELSDWKDWFLYKAKSWEYEQEYRVILELYKCSEKWVLENGVVNRNPKLNLFSPHERRPSCMFMFNIPEEAVRQVYFGCRMNSTTRQTILESIKSNQKLAHMEIFNSFIHPNDFSLVFEKH